VSGTAVRLVWHLDVDDAGTDLAVETLLPLLREGPQTS
jgi:threonine aldolase